MKKLRAFAEGARARRAGTAFACNPYGGGSKLVSRYLTRVEQDAETGSEYWARGYWKEDVRAKLEKKNAA